MQNYVFLLLYCCSQFVYPHYGGFSELKFVLFFLVKLPCPLLKESTTSPFRLVCQSPFLVKTDVVLLLSVVYFTLCHCCAYCICLQRVLDCCNSANTAVFVTWSEQRVWRLRVVCSIETRNMFH